MASTFWHRRTVFLPLLAILLAGATVVSSRKVAHAYSEVNLYCGYGQGCNVGGSVSLGSFIITFTGYDDGGVVYKSTIGGSCHTSSGCPFTAHKTGVSYIAWSYAEITDDGWSDFSYAYCTPVGTSPSLAPSAPGTTTNGNGITLTVTENAKPAPRH